MLPYFSIIIPMYNREHFIARAISSCLKQDFEDFEIIVVDDGSTDRSVKVVEEIKDPRIRLIKHDMNQERLIARNTGARASMGQWLIWFDSDDELVPEALAVMKQRISELPSDVLALRFMCRLDSGHTSPDPPYCDEIWNYEGYLRWVESHHGRWSESMPVVHRQTIQSVLFPEDKVFTGETQYNLDIAAKYRMRACVDILRLYHFDADNTSWEPDLDRMLKAAPAFAARIESIITIHGQSIKRWAPKTYEILFSGRITQLLLSRQKGKAWTIFIQSLSFRTFSLRIWVIMILGMVNPSLLAYAKVSTFRQVLKNVGSSEI